MRMESSIEAAFKKKILKWATGRGLQLECLKFVVPGVKGYPDRILIWGPAGRTMFIEFKQPGEPPEPLQDYVHGLMRAMGCEVQVHSNVEEALDYATRYIIRTLEASLTL